MNLPPHNLELEQALLGSILAHEGVMGMMSWLQGKHFYSSVHARIFEYMSVLDLEEQAIRPANLKQYLGSDESFIALGGMTYLVNTMREAVPGIQCVGYAHTIVDLWNRREILVMMEKTSEDLQTDFGQHYHDISGDFIDELASFEDPGSSNSLVAADALLDRVVDQIEDAFKDPDAVAGLHTGIKDLDRRLSGLRRQQLVILAGRPAMGKSTVASAIASGVATHNDNKEAAVVFSLEMSEDEWGVRMATEAVSRRGNAIEYGDAQSGRINRDQMLRLAAAPAHYRSAPLYIDEGGGRTIAQIRTICIRLKRKLGLEGKKLGAIVIDQLSHIASTGRYAGQRVNELGEITAALKALAKQLDVCVVLLHQLNRSVELRDNKRPMLSDLRDSGNIEQDADVVLFVYREEYYLAMEQPTNPTAISEWDMKMAAAQNRLEVIIAKQRMGSLGIVTLWCDMGASVVLDEADAPPDSYMGRAS